MDTFHFTCILLLTLLLSMTLFASSVRVFFTDDELNEMGIWIDLPDMEREGTTA